MQEVRREEQWELFFDETIRCEIEIAVMGGDYDTVIRKFELLCMNAYERGLRSESLI